MLIFFNVSFFSEIVVLFEIFNFSLSGSDDSTILLLLLHVLVIIEEAVFTVILGDELNLTIILF